MGPPFLDYTPRGLRLKAKSARRQDKARMKEGDQSQLKGTTTPVTYQSQIL